MCLKQDNQPTNQPINNGYEFKAGKKCKAKRVDKIGTKQKQKRDTNEYKKLKVYCSTMKIK